MTFDPSKHLRNIKGKGGNAEYLDVKWRLVWLRDEHPDAITEVEHIEISPDIAIFKATVSIPGGGSATDYGSETPRDFGDYIEKAATKALGRALAQLGYGTQFVGEELDEGDRIVDSPVDQQTRPRPQVARQQAQEPRNAPAPAAAPPDLDANLLARIRDDNATPEMKNRALHNYLLRAETLADMKQRETAVWKSGMPKDDLTRALDWHINRLAPASVAG